jgi:hypothetical protein
MYMSLQNWESTWQKSLVQLWLKIHHNLYNFVVHRPICIICVGNMTATCMSTVLTVDIQYPISHFIFLLLWGNYIFICCKTGKCKCKRENILCNSRCHASLLCANKCISRDIQCLYEICVSWQQMFEKFI